MQEERERLKEHEVKPNSSSHWDSRMSLTLDDLRPIFKGDPKVVYPLQFEGGRSSRKWNYDNC